MKPRSLIYFIGCPLSGYRNLHFIWKLAMQNMSVKNKSCNLFLQELLLFQLPVFAICFYSYLEIHNFDFWFDVVFFTIACISQPLFSAILKTEKINQRPLVSLIAARINKTVMKNKSIFSKELKKTKSTR